MDNPRSVSDLGEILRQSRRSQKLTQAALAERAGVQAHHISNIENGVTNPKVVTVFALLAALNLDWRITPRTAGAGIEDIF
ncbi:helix-turn-helix domain-containing protein [Paracoccus laeviglucosivorans]|uniref:Transcriptional regulator, XRE family n=1 Tax=Paracoccus laeviglucosivorans TaxID=1197861 RepID=A0A521F016_9RHOB|nr:helix-turn-helix transcriptional regulator [Paracoccus laeviglucosivorans]SMO89544.1 transcriptional regulator, XRE family [Paracoccus laeviglucosivorans]